MVVRNAVPNLPPAPPSLAQLKTARSTLVYIHDGCERRILEKLFRRYPTFGQVAERLLHDRERELSFGVADIRPHPCDRGFEVGFGVRGRSGVVPRVVDLLWPAKAVIPLLRHGAQLVNPAGHR